jgi:hypothetical protein
VRSGNSDSAIVLDRESVLTQLLAEMDGFSSKDGIVVMATTNRAVSARSINSLPCTVHTTATATATATANVVQILCTTYSKLHL